MFFLEELNIQLWQLIVGIITVFVAVITLIVIIVQRNRPNPLVTIDDEDGMLYYKNIGDAPAINIQSWEVTLNLISIIFPKINLLEPKTKKELIPKLSGKTFQAQYFVDACNDLKINKFPYFERLNIFWYTIVTHYENSKGRKYLSVVLVRSKVQKIEHKLSGSEWWIKFLDKLKLIRKVPKPPK